MPIPTATTDVSGEEQIDSLLGQDLNTGGDNAAGDTPMADIDTTPERETTERVDEQVEPEEVDETDAGDVEDESGDEGLEESDLETDFSDASYHKAAEHYSKTFGKNLDPNDAGDRRILQELLQRGQKIRELQSSREETPEVEETPEETPKPAASLTPEQREANTVAIMEHFEKYAEQAVVPKVAERFANKFLAALWPGKKIDFSQEQSTALAKAFTAFGSMLIFDAMPSFLNAVPNALVENDPIFATVRDMGMRESAVDEMLSATGRDGAGLYPDFERLVDNGSIKRMMNSEELKGAKFNDDPQKNLVAKLKIAYKMARNQPVNTDLIRKANERGALAERDRQRKVRSGRLPSGSSGTGFANPSRAENFMSGLIGSSGSKFSRALKEAHGNK